MVRFSLFQKITVGAGTIGGLLYYTFDDRRVAHASWTTGYIPSSHSKWDDNWDHRAPEVLVHPKETRNASSAKEISAERVNGKPTATRHLILIRHGQYNIDGSGDKERYLTKLGRTQAQCTASRLKSLNLPYTLIVKSTMTRAQETGEIINASLTNVPVKDCHLLREGAPIPPEPPIGHWKPQVYFYQDGARIEAAFREYFYRADPTQKMDSFSILVCHANVIRYFVCRALQFPPEGWLRLGLNHASITWISITPSGRVILRALGDSGHMPPDIITS